MNPQNESHMASVSNDRLSCDCNICKNACKTKPGWFKPGEAEKVAEYLNIPMLDLFNNYLAVDWFSGEGENYYPLSPSAKTNLPGEMWPYNPRGECIFYKQGKCSIHPVAPFECRAYTHADTSEEAIKRHGETAKEWKNSHDYLENLLGYSPTPPEPESFAEMLGFGWL